jgi:hypothetical protein
MPPVSPIDLLIPLLDEPPNLSALRDEASWNSIKENAGRYGVAALVAYAARSHVSPAERAWCDKVLTDSWMRYEGMLRQLEYVTGLFAGEGIRTIALKGPLLARRYYSPPFLRKPSMDLDLAVVEQDLEHACQVLIRAGYKLDMPIAEAIARTHHAVLDHPSRPRIELHVRLSHMTLGIPVDEFFDRAVTCRLPDGREALVLGPADQLLHLVLHLTQSRFGTLFHLCEIRRVSKAEPDSVRAEAAGRAADHHFCGALRMMDAAFRTRWNEPFLPPGVVVPRTWLNWRLTPSLYRAFERWSVPGRGLTLAARLHGRWLDFQMTDRPADAIREAAFFLESARVQFAAKRAWGTVKQLRFASGTPPTREQ